ncbi:uncharacterized protein EI97DRAFT_372095 [Westerdykella ornata]|uniref:G domain-containing protein n=1 Tax=Westerdykella ornata TaxID=318751 RepID=A0A6A6JT05_WESOR|nr:uncharacterized protein EI97DRAFT_372095 [Westerdykella ornata]KAF2278876.1 hypothetical protein EI97DRAFT_372095 [Westerdykella ornata]
MLSSTSDRHSTPSTILNTPLASPDADSIWPASDQDSVLQQIGGLHHLRLTSVPITDTSSSQRGTPTPSIHVTTTPPTNGSSRAPVDRTDSLVRGVTALHIASDQADPPGASGPRDSRLPSPSCRSRSGSEVNCDRHQVENEDPPQGLLHMPEPQETLATATKLMTSMADLLSRSNLDGENGSSIGQLYQAAINLSKSQLPSARIVGLVGDSGVGKSSLINSLLDREKLASTSSSGSACTCVVTEYHFHDKDGFKIQVDYFPLAELKKQFEELLRAYRDCPSLQNESTRTDEDHRDENDGKLLQQKADLARAIFQASFKEKEMLEQMPIVLSGMRFEDAVATMAKWAEQLVDRQNCEESFSNVEDCASRLKQLTSESAASSPNEASRTCWPFIRKLRVYLKAAILSKGLIIADLPGLRDLNSARRAITERYVRQCDQIFVVAEFKRAITDQSIGEIVKLVGRAGVSKVDIICTASELEKAQLTNAADEFTAEKGTIQDMKTEIEAHKEEITSLSEEIDKYEQDLGNLDQEQQKHYSQLRRERSRVKESKEDKKFKLRRYIMQLRNDKVSVGLQKQYRNHSTAKPLKVFCVSNTMYWENREKPAKAALPYLELSGILGLRRYCIEIVAKSRLHAAREFITDAIPAFLGSVELWVKAGCGNASVDGKQRILDAVRVIQRKLDALTSPLSKLRSLGLTLADLFDEQIYRRMQSEQEWADAAEDASAEWNGWHWAAYSAFCGHRGNYYTASVGRHSWNGEAMKSMKDDMSTDWDNFKSNVEAQVKAIEKAVAEAFDNSFKIARDAADSLSAMETFADTLRHRKFLIRHGIKRAYEKEFQEELSSLDTDAFSPCETAFIGQLMEDTYHKAALESGKGSHQRRKSLITGRFGDMSLFVQHRLLCEETFTRIAQDFQDKLIQIVDEQVGSVKADLKMLSDENAIAESEKDPEFRERVEAALERVRKKVGGLARKFENVP